MIYLKRLPILLLIFSFHLANAAEINIAVATNFLAPLETIAREYAKVSKDKIRITSGASGKFFAQIENGAPFDVFFSADQNYPQKLVEKKLAENKSRFTYAMGALVLWSTDPKLVDAKGEVLKANQFKHLAFANPELAPYGRAAEETLKNLNYYASVKSKLVFGENVGQTHQFIVSGNAELGFIPLSMVKDHSGGSQWLVPNNLFSPILQDAVILSASKNKNEAQKFLDYLKDKNIRKLIEGFGYTFKK